MVYRLCGSRPLRDTIVDYTWRTTHKGLTRCPVCQRKGKLQRGPAQDPIIVHAELLSDHTGVTIMDYCSVPALTDALLFKELQLKKDQTHAIKKRRY
jgi:hypothetical protein